LGVRKGKNEGGKSEKTEGKKKKVTRVLLVITMVKTLLKRREGEVNSEKGVRGEGESKVSFLLQMGLKRINPKKAKRLKKRKKELKDTKRK